MIRTLPATTGPGEIQDALADMTDGSTYVCAVEVYDHPEAVRVADRAPFGGDGGPGLLGSWVLGPLDEVYDHLQHRGFACYEEQYGAGGPSDEEAC